METKVCSKCPEIIPVTDFPTYKTKTNKIGYYSFCKACKKKRDKHYSIKNKDKINERQRTPKYRQKKNAYNRKNKDKRNLARNIKNKEKRQNNPYYKLRDLVSRRVREALKCSNLNLRIKYLNYSVNELQRHFQSLFEPWMTWDNYGRYKNSWNDTDPLTWTWQIDHIIPQSKLYYTSTEDENFKICWDLKNLRPLSAKENFKNGLQLIRKNDALQR
jgi:hypothetical protein